MSRYKETHLPQIVTPPRTVSPGTVKWVGRFTLWSMTSALLLISLSAITSQLWVLTPLSRDQTFLTIHRVILAFTYVTFAVTFLHLFVVHRLLVPPRNASFHSLEGARVHVGLTAWNDGEAIGHAVREFKSCPYVHKVVV